MKKESMINLNRKKAADKLKKLYNKFHLKVGFEALKKQHSLDNQKTLRENIEHIETTLKTFKDQNASIEFRLNELAKLKVDKDKLEALEKSLDKQRAITLYNDMQMYVDEAMNKFYQRFAYEFKQHKTDVK